MLMLIFERVSLQLPLILTLRALQATREYDSPTQRIISAFHTSSLENHL